ncbi:MAG TPA: hypothetical protein VMU53_09140 [Candidatus Sulfotelmatobacter sp.]|nr:hypothetical protein [Candidatus Sulfotelmatobacter sp.]
MADGVTPFVPLVASVPLQPPLAVHVVAFVVDHCNVDVFPALIVAGFALSVTVGAAATAANVSVAVADLLASACETAVMDMLALAGMLEGAVYRPDAVIVPLLEFPEVTPSTCQITPLFAAFETVAVNCCVLPNCAEAVAGEMLTVICPAPDVAA